MASKAEKQGLSDTFDYVSIADVSRRYLVFRCGIVVHDLGLLPCYDSGDEGYIRRVDVVFVRADTLQHLVGHFNMDCHCGADRNFVLARLQIFR